MKQSSLILTELTEHKKTICGVGNPGLGLDLVCLFDGV